MEEINKGTRIINVLIDFTVIGIVLSISSVILGSMVDENIMFLVIFILYYFCFEAFYGRTLGKRVTNTVVLNPDNSRPGKLKILIRTLLRLNPFDGISYLFGIEQGTHDYLSGTRLKKREVGE
jgi:uncharacterized RDD family membrane protein YckC